MKFLGIKCETILVVDCRRLRPLGRSYYSAVTWLHNNIWWYIFCPSLETSISLLTDGGPSCWAADHRPRPRLIMENVCLLSALACVTTGDSYNINYSREDPTPIFVLRLDLWLTNKPEFCHLMKFWSDTRHIVPVKILWISRSKGILYPGENLE